MSPSPWIFFIPAVLLFMAVSLIVDVWCRLAGGAFDGKSGDPPLWADVGSTLGVIVGIVYLLIWK